MLRIHLRPVECDRRQHNRPRPHQRLQLDLDREVIGGGELSATFPTRRVADLDVVQYHARDPTKRHMQVPDPHRPSNRRADPRLQYGNQPVPPKQGRQHGDRDRDAPQDKRPTPPAPYNGIAHDATATGPHAPRFRLRHPHTPANLPAMIYELRIYRCLPGRLPALLKRFETITLPIWQRHGIHQAGFWTTLIGQSNQELTYLLAWDSMADRERKWTAFQSDPEWIAKRAETEKDGQIVADIVSQFLQPTSFSSVR